MRSPVLLFLALIIIVVSCKNNTKDANSADSNESIHRQILYHGGTIITMEGPAGSEVEAVVTQDDKIMYTGSLAEAESSYPNAVNFNLEGSTLFPGLIEQHLHPFLGALTLSVPVIAPEAWELPGKTWPAVHDHDSYITALKNEFAKHDDPNTTFFTWGYNNFFHGTISRTKLDAISNETPIAVWHRSAHEFYVNTPFLKKYGVSADDVAQAPESVQEQISIEKGHFFENGLLVYLLGKVVKDLATPERLQFGIEQMVALLHQNGVTSYNEPGALVDESAAALYKKILASPDTPMYSYFIYEGNTNYMKYGDETLEHVGEVQSLFPETGKLRFFKKQVKFLADGAIISQLMQMKDGYLDGHEGQWMLEPALLEKGSKLFWDAGYQLHIHVNGDEGLEMVLNTIERRMEENPRKDHRTVIIHFANSTAEQVQKLADLGCIVSANPYYVTGFADKFSEIGLGKERAEAMVRLKPVEDLGVSFSLHSDLPMAPADPLYLAWCAVNRVTNNGNTLRPDLAVSLHGALKAITIDAAYSWQMEDELGSIKPGKIANFTLLKQNPYTYGKERLKDIEILGTVFEGKHFPLEGKRNKEEKARVGGWSNTQITSDVQEAAEFVVSRMNNASALKEVLSAKKQVVKGFNYELTYSLDNNSVWTAQVHRDLDGNFSLLKEAIQKN